VPLPLLLVFPFLFYFRQPPKKALRPAHFSIGLHDLYFRDRHSFYQHFILAGKVAETTIFHPFALDFQFLFSFVRGHSHFRQYLL
jgi:hypothetical protein